MNTCDEYLYVNIGRDSSPATQYIADTNVISHVESMLRSGQPTKQTSQRNKAANLAWRLSRNPEVKLIDDFALIEGSSFHSVEGLKATSVLLRDACYELLNSRPANLYTAAAAIQGFGQPEGYDQEVLTQLDQSIEIMMQSVVPAYYAALMLEHWYGEGALARLDETAVGKVLESLSANFNFVPGTLWSTLILATCGNQESRTAALGVLKTGQRSKRVKAYLPTQNALSAAWDLGSIQTLSNKLGQGVHAVLVTEDKALAALVARISIRLRPRALHIPEEVLDNSSAGQERLDRLQHMYGSVRAGKRPAIPTREAAAVAIEAMETLLGSRTAMPAVLHHGFKLRSPSINYAESDLAAAAGVLTSLDGTEHLEAEAALLQVDDATLPFRLHALIALTLEVTSMVAIAEGKAALSLLSAHLKAATPEVADYIQVVIDFEDSSKRPLSTAARYELLTREDRIRNSTLQMSRSSRWLCKELAVSHTNHLSALVAEAALTLRHSCPLTD